MEKAYPIDTKIKAIFIVVGSTEVASPLILKGIAIVRGLDIEPKNSSDLVIMLCLYAFMILGGLLTIVSALRTRLLVSPKGIVYRSFNTHRTTWENIEGVLVTPYGFTLALKEPMNTDHQLANAMGSVFGANRRLPLICHMQQWRHGGLEEEFREYAPHLFKEARFSNFP